MVEGSDTINGKNNIDYVLKKWGTCRPKRKRDVLHEFYECVNKKLARNAYSSPDDVKKDLEIVNDLMSKFVNESTTFRINSRKLDVEFLRARLRFIKIELYLRKVLESDEDIPEHHKAWMEGLCTRKIDCIKINRMETKDQLWELHDYLKKMGHKAGKRKKFQREEMDQTTSEAFQKEQYMLIIDDKERDLLLQRKFEEYKFWHQEMVRVNSETEKVCAPYEFCAVFDFCHYREQARGILRQLKKKIKQL